MRRGALNKVLSVYISLLTLPLYTNQPSRATVEKKSACTSWCIDDGKEEGKRRKKYIFVLKFERLQHERTHFQNWRIFHRNLNAIFTSHTRCTHKSRSRMLFINNFSVLLVFIYSFRKRRARLVLHKV